MAFRCRHLKTATSVPWRRERKVLRLEAKTTFTKAFSKESACKSRAVSRKYRIMDLAGDHLSFGNFFRLIGPDSREPSKPKGEQRCPLLFFNSGFPAQRLLVALPDSSEGAPKLQPHNPAHPVPPRGFWRNPPIKRIGGLMKIITNVALAACVGISLGWMASCSTEHVTETTTTREVDTAPPPPAIVTAAPVVTEPVVSEPVVTVPPNASTTSTTTQFNNGTVEKKTVTQYNSAYPPVVPPAPVVVTTVPGQATTTETTTDNDGDVQRRTTTTVVTPVN